MAGQAVAEQGAAQAGIPCEVQDGCAIFRPVGVFDARAAGALGRTLEQVAEPQQVVIDFSRVQLFVDVAVAVLTAGLRGRRVELRGLGRHQESVFRCFGVPIARTPPPPWYRPEEPLAF